MKIQRCLIDIRFFKIIFFGTIMLGLFACSSAETKRAEEKEVAANRAEDEIFESGLKALKDEKYGEALKYFSDFQRIYPASKYTVAVDYNIGLALMGVKNWPEAAEKFRGVVQIAAGKAPIQEAQALYQLALCYEALGEDSRVVASLLDALKRTRYYSEETVVELQARMAAAYARLGNEKEADSYYKKADRKLQALQRKSGKKQTPSWLARTLYNMGKMSLKKLSLEDFETGLKPVDRGQIWLLKGAEAADPTWSPKCSFELIQIYRDAWGLIENVPLSQDEDELIARKQQQQQKVRMSLTLQGLLEKLKLRKITIDEQAPPYVHEIFTFLDDMDKKLDGVIQSRPVEQQLTPAAQEREGLKRKGTIR